MRVLIIPEDPDTDQYVLKPIISEMLTRLGKPHANVRVLQDPHMRGIGDALNREMIKRVVDRYRGMVDIFLLIVDRDNNAGRRDSLNAMEQFVRETFENITFLGECAWQEVEVWLLAGHALPSGWRWNAIREHTHPKEQYFEPFATAKNLQNSLGGGRQRLSLEAAANYPRIRTRCPEDVQNLELRLSQVCEAL